MRCQYSGATSTSRKPCQVYPEKFSKPLFLPGGLFGQVYFLLITVAVGVGPILQMHLCPKIIPLAPASTRIEQDCVGPGAGAWLTDRAVGWTAGWAVASVGTPEGSPPV